MSRLKICIHFSLRIYKKEAKAVTEAAKAEKAAAAAAAKAEAGA